MSLTYLQLPPFATNEARCAQSDPDEWFPEKGGSTRWALSICRRCPLLEECREWAIEHNEPYGVWGGTTAKQRDLIRLQRRAGLAAAA